MDKSAKIDAKEFLTEHILMFLINYREILGHELRNFKLEIEICSGPFATPQAEGIAKADQEFYNERKEKVKIINRILKNEEKFRKAIKNLVEDLGLEESL